MRYLQDRFNDVLFEEATKQGVDFINPTLLWAGHEPCASKGQWTNSIETNPLSDYLSRKSPLGTGPFHPNPAGQQAIAALVSCYLKVNPVWPKPRGFTMPTDWLIPPAALTLANGRTFPREWGTHPSDFSGCGFPPVAAAATLPAGG